MAAYPRCFPAGFCLAIPYRLIQILALAWLLVSAARAEPNASPPGMLEDAELTDVFFGDVDRGWAVGDRGVILLTEDGGRRWRLADCPVNCRLESVCFVDEQHGWAVGGWSHPYTHNSTGVVLQTTNGGRRWTRLSVAALPALKQIQMLDRQHGWAVGNRSAMYPSGVFRTEDGGRSWTGVPVDSSRGRVAVAAIDARETLVLSGDGSLATATQPRSGDDEDALDLSSTAGWRRARALELGQRAAAWIVGDGGLLLRSGNQGRSWQPCSSVPRGAQDVDFSAIAHQGENVWVAGAPGSCIFHSPDNGASWQTRSTGETVPIKALHFLDEGRGWAVGSLGTILATRDGGRSWVRQRGAPRVALLGLFSEPEDVPFELLTQLSGHEGFLSCVEIINRRDIEPAAPSESSAEARVHEAVVDVGGGGAETAWAFPLRQKGLFLAADSVLQQWQSTAGGEPLRKLEEHLVKEIRQWRADVLVTQQGSADGQDSMVHLIHQAVMSAVERAADPDAYPEQISRLGLQPWRTKKLFASVDDRRSANVTLQTSQLAPRLGRSLVDHASHARGLIASEWSSPPARMGFRLLASKLPRDAASRDFFSGISLAPGQAGRRELGQAAASDLRALSQAAQKQRNIQQLLKRSVEYREESAAWLGQVDDLVHGLPESAAGQILFQLAQTYRLAGRYDLAAETLMLLIRRDSDHALAEPALMWLTRYLASGEVEWALLRHGRQQGPSVVEAPSDAQSAVAPIPFDGPIRPQPLAAFDSPGARSVPGNERSANLIKLNRFLRRQSPELQADPRIRLPVAADQRRRGAGREAQQYWRRLASTQLGDAWQQTGRAEQWLHDSRGHCPKSLVVCQPVEQKPYLDGRCDDPLWQACQPAELSSSWGDDEQWPARVRWAYDREFLYIAIQCRKASAAEYAEGSGPRPRDPDLSRQDRVELLLDIDRDYSTFYRLTVDHRGWTGEACFGDASWDPAWYVASSSDDTSWTIEAAVPWEELTERPPSGDAWALGIQRVVPGVGFQSWTQPATMSVRPEGFGYLQFDAESRSP